MTDIVFTIVDAPEPYQCIRCMRSLERKDFYVSMVTARICKLCYELQRQTGFLRTRIHAVKCAVERIENQGGKRWRKLDKELNSLIDILESERPMFPPYSGCVHSRPGGNCSCQK